MSSDQPEYGSAAGVLLNEPVAASAGPWVVTALSEYDPGDHGHEDRLTAAVAVLERVFAAGRGPGVVLFPAGWLSSGEGEPRTLYPEVISRLAAVLARSGPEAIVCLGIDRGDGRDQIGVAVGGQGVVALARKFYPTADEWDSGIVAADGFLEQEDGHGRVFTAGGRQFYLAVCNDIYGVRHEDLRNPGVDAVLGLVHGFCPWGQGASGDTDFARKGLAGASRQWGCPVFAAAVFWDRPVPERWPSGVLWDRGEEGVKTWRYDYNRVTPSGEDRFTVGAVHMVLRPFTLSSWRAAG